MEALGSSVLFKAWKRSCSSEGLEPGGCKGGAGKLDGGTKKFD